MSVDIRQRSDAAGRVDASKRSRLFSFPDPVNELAARTVAGGVLVMAAGILALSLTAGPAWLWLCTVLAYGFLARTATGPSLSPLGQLATRIIAPRIGPARPVPGPPKRFAQAIGAAVTTTTVVLVALTHYLPAQVLVAVLMIFAALECTFGLCVGCRIFAALMRAGLIPAHVCQACNDIALRTPSTTTNQR